MSEGGTAKEEGSARSRLRAVLRPGVFGSLVLHAAVLGFLLYQIGAPPLPVAVIPVDVVQLAEETASKSPQPNAQAALPGAGSSPRLASVAPPRAAAPPAQRPQAAPAPQAAPPSALTPAPDAQPPTPQTDPLQSQLEALAKLRVPNSAGTAVRPSGSNAPAGAQSGYRVEDLIRAQVQRRWSLRLDELGERDLVVSIHVVLEPDGTVAVAEIVDADRGKTDNLYRSIALSARNAVLLSSPLTLPAGITAEMRDMVISFNTRDTQR